MAADGERPGEGRSEQPPPPPPPPQSGHAGAVSAGGRPPPPPPASSLPQQPVWAQGPRAAAPGAAPGADDASGRLLPIRPLTVAEMLDVSFRCLRATFVTAAVLVLVIQGPYQLVSSLVLDRLLVGFDDPALIEQTFTDVDATVNFFARAASAGTLLSVVGLLVNVVTGAAIVWLVLRTDAGEDAGVAGALRAARAALWPTFGGGLLLVLLGGAAALALVALLVLLGLAAPPVAILLGLLVLPPAFLVGMALMYLVPPVAVSESGGPWATLRRCLWVVRRRFGRVLGITLLMTILVGIISMTFTLPLGLLAGTLGRFGWIVDGLASTLATLVSLPLVTVAALLLYLDARVRLEGYDLELRARRLGGG